MSTYLQDWLTVLAIALFVGLTFPDVEPKGCSTDSECMELCPPPADEPQCDGGPR